MLMGRRSRLLALTATAVAFAAVLSAPALAAAPASRPAYMPRQLLVRFRDRVGPTARAAIRGRHGARLRHALLIHNLQLLQLPAGQSVGAAAASFRRERDVPYAEPNFLYHAATVPNDPFFPQLWGLSNTGQAVAGAHGSPAADVNAPAAW